MPHNNDNTRETHPMRATIYDNPDHELLREQVARFLAREVEPHAAAWEEAGMVPRDVLRRMGQAGLLGIAFEGEYGGGDADALTNLVFAEALSQSTFAGFIITVLVHTDMASPHLHHAGTPAQKDKASPAMAPATVAAKTSAIEPVPIPTQTPQSSQRCHGWVIKTVVAALSATKVSAVMMTLRTVKRSIKAAANGAIKPYTSTLMAIAVET